MPEQVQGIIDGHIHIFGEGVDQESLVKRMREAGVSGGVLISKPPAAFGRRPAPSADERLENLFAWTEGNADLYPVFWIDPLESDAPEQVALAREAGVIAYKVICDHFYPHDPRALDVFRAIAEVGKPILFHSGVLWDGQDSSRYNRPADFEALLGIDDLRFSLAHISWPWCAECIAVYGKWQHSRASSEMFVDTTPGTPPIYREDALTKLFTVGYRVEGNVFFGSDCTAGDYRPDRVRKMIERDQAIYDKLGLPKETREKVFAGNIRRFLGA